MRDLSYFTENYKLLLLMLPGIWLFYKTYSIHGLIIVFCSIQIHELGHYLGFKFSRLTITDLQVYPNYINVTVEEEAIPPKTDIVISSLGPLFGLLSIGFLYPYMLFIYEPHLITGLCITITSLQLFNLIPFEGYDGYYILKAVGQKYH